MLRQNRRLVSGSNATQQADLDAFHGVLEDVAHGKATLRVREALVAAYVRGAMKNQETVEFEHSTACVTKRRYRDRWNGKVLTRIGKRYGRSLRVKAVFLARGAQKQWVRDTAAREIRRTVRSQCLKTLRLAGQWLGDPPIRGEKRPHCMRVMLVANIDVEHGHANGATGRLVRWSPENSISGVPVKSVRANAPEVQAWFYHETSYQSSKRYFLPQVDFLDVEPKKEVVATAKGKPSMLQLTLQPGYCLSIHKVQALTIRHDVHGCLEGVFALGQVYVLWSRVTDPKLFQAVGILPADLLDDVARAWADAGLDVEACFAAAAQVTGEWKYTHTTAGKDACRHVQERLKQVREEETRVRVKLCTLSEILNPQPKAADVVHALLAWVDQADLASQRNEMKPAFKRKDGHAIFPPDDEWWLTEFERRKPHEPQTDLAGDSIPDENLTKNPDQAGHSSSEDDTDEDDSGISDDGLPAGPRRHKKPRSSATCSYRAEGSQGSQSCQTEDNVNPGITGRRRLHEKTGPARTRANAAWSAEIVKLACQRLLDSRKADPVKHGVGCTVEVNAADVQRLKEALDSENSQSIGILLWQLLRADLDAGVEATIKAQQRLVTAFFGHLHVASSQESRVLGRKSGNPATDCVGSNIVGIANSGYTAVTQGLKPTASTPGDNKPPAATIHMLPATPPSRAIGIDKPSETRPSASNAEKEDDLETLLAGSPDGRLHVSLASYHDLPRAVQRALKGNDSRVVVSGDAEPSTPPASSNNPGPRHRSGGLYLKR